MRSRLLKRIAVWVLRLSAVLALAIGAAVVGALFLADRTFSAAAPDLRAVTDSAAIDRGRYLVLGPGHCADCHAPPSEKSRVDAGQAAELSGGYALRTFLGEMIASNLTADSATGIGGVPDRLLIRFFRAGIDHRGHVGLPVMDYTGLSDADLVAVLSYLRSLAPVRHEVPPSRYNLLGKITKAYFLKPFDLPSGPPPAPVPAETREYGAYLAEAVANCGACHTARDMRTGEFTGPRLAGGLVFHKADKPELICVSPNLTPDPRTGAIFGWSRERFIERIRKGSLREWSPMPWGPFSRMTETDLGALYLFLQSLPPISRDPTGPGEKQP